MNFEILLKFFNLGCCYEKKKTCNIQSNNYATFKDKLC